MGEGQAVLINCLLRNYLNYNLYNQADKLVLKSTFPEQASNSEWARYYYYLGRIKAIQLAYSEAHSHLLQSGRKAPQSSAPGFKQHVAKLSITVDLLLTQAVKSGDLVRFGEVVKKFAEQFSADHTYT